MAQRPSSKKKTGRSPFAGSPVAAPWQALVSAFTGVVVAFGLRPAAPPTAGLRSKWRGHTLDLARAMLTMIEEEPALFHWLPFTPAQLRVRIEQVSDLIAVQVRLEEFVATFTAALYQQRADLFDWVSEASDGLQRLLDSPHLDAAQRQRLRDVSAPVRAIIEEYGAQVQAARLETLSKNERLAAAGTENERLAAENAVLRKGEAASLSAPLPAAPPRKGRRTRR